MKFRNRVGVIAATAVISAVAVAQTAAPAKSAAEAKTAVDTRQAHFETIKKTYEPLTAMLKNQKPFDAAVVGSNASKLKDLIAAIPAKYTVDTRAFKDIKTSARDAVWASAADFKAKADASSAAADALATVAKSGDAAGTKKAIADLGRSCGACHDSFRAKSE